MFKKQQWHLKYLMIDDVWKKNITGENICVCVVDTGVYYHPDLIIDKKLSYNNVNKQPLLIDGTNDDAHGTVVAGIIGAKGDKYCYGIAPNCKLASYNYIGSRGIDNNKDLSKYMIKNMNKIDIFNNSWTSCPSFINPIINNSNDDIFTLLKTFKKCCKYGRNGKGNIFVFSCGNLNTVVTYDDNDLDFTVEPYFDQVAYDSLINSRFNITVGAMRENLVKATFSEWGSCLLCVGITNDFDKGADIAIVSTFPQYENYYPITTRYSGTSVTCPMISGIIALLLQYRNDLTWRDVKELISRSCYIVDGKNFRKNGANRNFSAGYGFGFLSPKLLLKNARKWTLLPKERKTKFTKKIDNINLQSLNEHIFNFELPITDNIIIETVTLKISINNNIIISKKKILDLKITLFSPYGTMVNMARPNLLTYSELNQYPELDPNYQYYDNYPILCELYRGECSKGVWILQITDMVPDFDCDTVSLFQKCKIIIHGH